MRRPPHRLQLLALLLPLSLAAHANNAAQLSTVRVEARTPTQDDTIARSTLQNSQARDLQDIYTSDSEVSVGGGSNPIAQKVYIRGIEEALLNLSIDGAFHNGKIYHHQSTLIIDPYLIKRVEVEKGTAAASAGPGALAGAIRLETVDAKDLLLPGQTIGGSIGAGFSSNKGHNASLSAYGVFGGKVDALFSSSHLDTRNYKDGKGQTVPDSATEQAHYLAKLGFNLAPGHRIAASHQRSSDEGVRNTRANMVGFFHPLVPNDPIPQSLVRDTSTLRYEGNKLGFVDKAEAVLYRSQAESDRTSKAGRNYGEKLVTTGFDLNLKSALGQHLLKYGVNWRDESSAARNIANPLGKTGSGKEDSRIAGAYAEGTLDFSPVTLSAGLRFDDYVYHDNHDQTFKSHGFSPSANLSWDMSDRWQLTAGHARALRGVGSKEAFMLDIASWKNQPDIEPEKAANSEIGLRFEQGGFNIKGNIYHQTIKNFITSLQCSGNTVCRDNAGNAKVEGFELASEYRYGNLNAGLSVGKSKPTLEGRPLHDGDLGLGTTTGMTWVAKLGYTLPEQGLEFGWQGRLVEGINYVPVGGTSTGLVMHKPGYGIHDVYVSWLPLKKDTLRVNLAVKNLFNKHYYDQATYAYQAFQKKTLGYAEAGRDIRLNVNWRF